MGSFLPPRAGERVVVVMAVVSVVSCSGHPDSHARAGVPSVVVMLFSNILTYPSLSLSLYFLSS